MGTSGSEGGSRNQQLVPAYLAADPGGQATLAAAADTFAAIALVTNVAGNFLGWGVVVRCMRWPPYYPRAAALDRMAWPAVGRSLVGWGCSARHRR